MTTIWDRRINAAQKSGSFSDRAKKAASHWHSCAVGTTIDLPHKNGRSPRHSLDNSQYLQIHRPILNDLGYSFTSAVAGDHPIRAEKIYHMIKEMAK